MYIVYHKTTKTLYSSVTVKPSLKLTCYRLRKVSKKSTNCLQTLQSKKKAFSDYNLSNRLNTPKRDCAFCTISLATKAISFLAKGIPLP